MISTTYSLAPEHPYPAALNDIVAILAGLPALADRHGLDTNRVLLSGGSAGASLAMSAALRQRDAGLPLPRGLALFYGAYDIANTSRESHRLFGDGRFGMSKARVDYYARALIPPGVSAADPYLSPIHADPAGLPPVWMGVAELDVLRDEQLEMAERLRAAAVSVEVRRYPGMIHGFVNRVCMVPMAATAISDAVRFLQAHA